MSVAAQPLPRAASLRRVAQIAAVAASMLVAVAAGAQSVPRGRVALGVVAGAAQFDMAGTGTTAFGAIRADEELTSWLLVEESLGFMRPHEQRTADVSYVIPELQLQAQTTLGRVRPYLGAGIGLVAPLPDNGHRKYAVGSASLGARSELTPTVDLRGELRVTGVSATLALWTIGLTRRL